MKRLVLAFAAFCVSFPAIAEYGTTGDIEWTWDGSFKPPIQSGDGDYPSQRQANSAFERAVFSDPQYTVDFQQLAPGRPIPSGIFLFACKQGGYDSYRHKVDHDPNVVHCQTFFMDDGQRKMYRRPVNFVWQNVENWSIVLPMRPRELPRVSTVDTRSFSPPPLPVK